MAPQASWPPDVPAESLEARSAQPGVLSQASSARIPQPEILSKDSPPRKFLQGICTNIFFRFLIDIFQDLARIKHTIMTDFYPFYEIRRHASSLNKREQQNKLSLQRRFLATYLILGRAGRRCPVLDLRVRPAPAPAAPAGILDLERWRAEIYQNK